MPDFPTSQISSRISTYSTSTSYTATSSSTIPGPGALAGKVILTLGKFTLRQIDNIVIRRRTKIIFATFPHKDNGVEANDVGRIERMYDDILELTRPGIYSDNIRKPMLQLISTQIKTRQTRFLLRSLRKWPYIEIILILVGIMNHMFPTLSESEWMENWKFDKTFSRFINGMPGSRSLLDFTSEVASIFPPEVAEIVDQGMFYLNLPFGSNANPQIERSLQQAKTRVSGQVNVLVLDSGNSGKSEMLKEMRQYYGVVRSAKEIESYRQVIFQNIMHGMNELSSAMQDLDLNVLEENDPHLSFIQGFSLLNPAGESFSSEFYEPLCSIWNDPNVQRAWSRRNEINVPENLAYFLPALGRLFSPTYLPTEEDISWCESRTPGIVETVYRLRDKEVKMIAVDGQMKSERRKWIHQFQDVCAIIFVVDLSCYDQCLAEDKNANQMRDALTIWSSICHSQWFKDTSFILVQNNVELFEQKAKRLDIHKFFPDYIDQPGNVHAGRDYFKKRFLRLARKRQTREVYIAHEKKWFLGYISIPSHHESNRRVSSVPSTPFHGSHLSTSNAVPYY